MAMELEAVSGYHGIKLKEYSKVEGLAHNMEDNLHNIKAYEKDKTEIKKKSS